MLLSINVKKTNYMIFRFPQKHIDDRNIPQLSINNQNLIYVKFFKFLGLYIDETLTWNKHMDSISLKLTKLSGILYKLQSFIPQYILKMIYDSLALPHLHFCIGAWGFNNLDRIKNIQKRLLRTITLSKYNAHTQPLCKQLKTLLIEDIFSLYCMKFYYLHENNKLPQYFTHMFFKPTIPKRIVSSKNSHADFLTDTINLRPIISKEFTNRTLSQNCIRHTIPKIITFPELVVNKIYTHSFVSFKKYCKTFLIEKYQATCNVRNCYVCQQNE